MKTILLAFACIFILQYTSEAQTDNRYRKARVEHTSRKQAKQENKTQASYRRAERRNQKQLKKSFKQSNRRSKRSHGSNNLGDVFQGL
ncbi:MAG: hypothetical protein EOP51_08990 [Sphingobacteriales bacterium]|nr:MAG: hypothetical protein EOP51_08990 [Sphingobacteriales bacterium]